jgi:hypothetical protein
VLHRGVYGGGVVHISEVLDSAGLLKADLSLKGGAYPAELCLHGLSGERLDVQGCEEVRSVGPGIGEQ